MSASSGLFLLLAIVFSFAVGVSLKGDLSSSAGAAQCLDQEARDKNSQPKSAAARVPAAEAPRPSLSTPQTSGTVSTQPLHASALDPELFSPALLQFARDRYIEAFQTARGEHPGDEAVEAMLLEFQERVKLLPRQLAQGAVADLQALNDLDAAIEGADGIALLKLIREGTFTPTAEDTGRLLDRCVSRQQAGPFVDGGAFLRGTEPLSDSMTLRLDPGVHRVDEARLRGPERGSFPANLRIEGAGIDKTLLYLADLSARVDVRRLSLANLTIHADNDGLFDLRAAGMSLDMERVRVIGFDAAHGGCKIFSVRPGALLRVRNCEFLGGYGKSPGNGQLLRLSYGFARFENCRFEGFTWRAPDLQGILLFKGCHFDRMSADPRIDGGGAVFQGSSWGGNKLPPSTERQQLDLKELLPFVKQ